MNDAIPDHLLSQISAFVAAQMGLHFPQERWRDLERGIRAAAPELGFEDAAECARWLISAPLTRGQLEVLASHLTVGETYFFREKRSFEILEGHILPELIRSRQGGERRLRIWSAGCSSGEEPYSVAILVSQLIADWENWNITILATDVNPHFLRKAAQGVYSEWSFRGMPRPIREKFFERRAGGRFEILPYLRKMVTFAYLNLAEDSYPSLLNNTNAMDVIFCRNVLMYFAPGQAEKVVRNLHLSLVDGGWLIVGASEASSVLSSQLRVVNFPDATLYRKESRPPQAQILPPRREEEAKMTPQAPREPGPQPREAPKSAELRRTPYAEAQALYEQGRYVEAAAQLLELLAHRPGDSTAMALLARAYANQGKLEEALKWCERAITADRLDAGLHYLHATVLQACPLCPCAWPQDRLATGQAGGQARERGVVADAVASLKRALYLDPNLVLAHFALGNLALGQGKIKEANRHFTNVLSLLSAYRPEDILPESEGMTAGRLEKIVRYIVS